MPQVFSEKNPKKHRILNLCVLEDLTTDFDKLKMLRTAGSNRTLSQNYHHILSFSGSQERKQLID